MPEENVLSYEFLIQIMNRLEFFNKFGLKQKQTLARYSSHFAVYEPGEVLIKQGESDSDLYIVLSGRVMVSIGNNSTAVAMIEAGEFFGEISFLTKSPRTATITAQERTIVIKISEKTLNQLDIELRETIKDQIIKKLVQRLEEMNNLFINNGL